MSNLPFGNERNKIPQTLEDCLKPDDLSTHLVYWADKIRQIGHILLILLVVVGVLFSLANSLTTVEASVGGWYSTTKTEFHVVAFLTSLVTWGIYVFLEYLVYQVVALLVEGLARIVRNTQVTARAALYQAQQAALRTEADEGGVPAEPSTYIPKEECTRTPTVAPRVIPVKVYRNRQGDIVCPTCGAVQEKEIGHCAQCGQVFIDSNAHVPYWCGSCGHEGPYDGPCPVCGSTMKKFNR